MQCAQDLREAATDVGSITRTKDIVYHHKKLASDPIKFAHNVALCEEYNIIRFSEISENFMAWDYMYFILYRHNI